MALTRTNQNLTDFQVKRKAEKPLQDFKTVKHIS
jgi:hypothetical protein